jgi:DNA-binding MarR family transcriptional regulator
MSQLAESSHQVSATMTGIVDRLVERGLVARERDPQDRRTLRVDLTLAGRELLEQVRYHKRTWLLQFLEELSPGERRTMIEMAGRYLAIVEKSYNPAWPSFIGKRRHG